MTVGSASPPRTAATVPGGEQPRELHIVFHVDGVAYAIRGRDVLHLECFTGATPVPGAKPFVAGILQLRGRVVPVVDLRARFGLAPRAATPDSRVVVTQTGGRVIALLADSAREIVELGDGDIAPPPKAVDDGSMHFVSGVGRSKDRLFLLLDTQRVVHEEESDEH